MWATKFAKIVSDTWNCGVAAMCHGSHLNTLQEAKAVAGVASCTQITDLLHQPHICDELALPRGVNGSAFDLGRSSDDLGRHV